MIVDSSVFPIWNMTTSVDQSVDNWHLSFRYYLTTLYKLSKNLWWIYKMRYSCLKTNNLIVIICWDYENVIIEDRVVTQRASFYVSGKTLISGSEQEVEQLNFADGKHLLCHFQPFKIFISNKAGMSYSCDSSVLQGFNAYPWGTIRYTDESYLGWYDIKT